LYAIPNPLVKTQAIKFFNVLYNQLGARVFTFLPNSDDKIAKSLQSEFSTITPTLIQPDPE